MIKRNSFAFWEIIKNGMFLFSFVMCACYNSNPSNTIINNNSKENEPPVSLSINMLIPWNQEEVIDYLVTGVVYRFEIHSSSPIYYKDLSFSFDEQASVDVTNIEKPYDEEYDHVQFSFYVEVIDSIDSLNVHVSHKTSFFNRSFEVRNNDLAYSLLSVESGGGNIPNQAYLLKTYNDYKTAVQQYGVKSIGLTKTFFDTNDIVLTSQSISSQTTAIKHHATFIQNEMVFTQVEITNNSYIPTFDIIGYKTFWVSIPKIYNCEIAKCDHYLIYRLG